MLDHIAFLHSLLLDPDRFPVLLGAFFLTALVGMVTGPSHGNAYPWLYLITGATFGRLGERLDRRERKPADLVFRGFILTIVTVLALYGISLWLRDIAKSYPFWGITEIFFLSFTLTSGSVWYSVLKLYFAMRDNKVGKGAYFALARSTRTDLSAADDYTITRMGMGLCARSFDKGLVAPAFWYLLFGLPGAFIYSALMALSWRFGRDGFTKGFGRMALWLEKLMGFVPMLLSGGLLALAGLFTPTGGMTRAFIGQIFGKGKAGYDQGGLPVTAMAYSLNVSLGGPRVDLDGSAIRDDWVGPPEATARLDKGHLRRAIYINIMAHLLFVATILGAMLWAHRLAG